METTENTYTAATATDREVEYTAPNGKRHMVALIADTAGNVNWCSRKFIVTRGAFSGSWLQIPRNDLTGWAPVA